MVAVGTARGRSAGAGCDWADGEARPRVMLWRDGDTVVCRLTSAAGAVEVRFPAAHFDAAALEPGSPSRA